MCRMRPWLAVWWVAGVLAAEPAPPEKMLPKLAPVTADMVEQIKQACPAQALAQPAQPRRVLIFSLCDDFVHDSVLVSSKALQVLGEQTQAWRADVSYDYGVFTPDKLAAYDAVVLNNCQNMKLPKNGAREALLDFVRRGKGLVVFHAAVDNFGGWPEGRAMVGGAGAGHPWGHYKPWKFKVEEPQHPLTAMFDPAGFSARDEQYQYDPVRTNRGNVRVLVSMDLSDPSTAKDDNGQPRGFRTDGLNPVVWVRHEGRGRVFVDGFGHNQSTWWDRQLLKLCLAGLQYALGDLAAEDDPARAPTPVAAPVKPADHPVPTPMAPVPTRTVAAQPTPAAPAARGSVVQLDVAALLNARPVTTLTEGKLVTWTMGVDGGGRGSGYLTQAAALAVGDQDPKALPDNPLIPADGARPAMLLHYANDDGVAPQAALVTAERPLVLSTPHRPFSHLWLAWTSAEGGSDLQVECTYADGTTTTRSVHLPDYFNDVPANQPALAYVVHDLAKWGRNNKQTERNHHNIHAVDVAPDAGRELISVKVSKSPTKSHLLFWAATGVVADGGAPAAVATVTQPFTGAGLKAVWWNNNAFRGEPVLVSGISKFNPLLNGDAAPFPATNPPLGPEYVTARLTGKLIPKVGGEYKFVSNADDYVGLWVNGVPEIAWSGHTAKDRFSAHTLTLVKDQPLDIRLDYRQDKLGYKLTLRLAHQPDGEQVDFGPTVGEFVPGG